LKAGLELNRILENIGTRDYRIARYMIARDMGAYQDPRTQRERDYLHRRFKDILTDLAIHFQFMGKTRHVA
jgi:hypothetical protein